MKQVKLLENIISSDLSKSIEKAVKKWQEENSYSSDMVVMICFSDKDKDLGSRPLYQLAIILSK